jgi:hypothetical protein
MMRVDAGGRNITGLYVLHDGTNTVSLTGKEWAALHDDLIARLAAVEAERDRLREVCQEIIGECPTSEPTEGGRFFSPSVHAYDIAMWTVGQQLRAALATPANAGEGEICLNQHEPKP